MRENSVVPVGGRKLDREIRGGVGGERHSMSFPIEIFY